MWAYDFGKFQTGPILICSTGWFWKFLDRRNFVIPFKYEKEYFHIDIFFQYSQFKQLHQLALKLKNVCSYFGFLRRMQKNKVHNTENLLSMFTVFYVYVIKGNTDKQINLFSVYES